MSDISPRLRTATLLADGAMDTALHAGGVASEECFDELNLGNPAVVAAVQGESIGAGAQIVLTNAFVPDLFKPELVGLAAKCAKAQSAGAEAVWKARAESSLGRVHA